MRAGVTYLSLGLLLRLAAAQIEIPDGIEIPEEINPNDINLDDINLEGVDLENVDLENLNLEELQQETSNPDNAQAEAQTEATSSPAPTATGDSDSNDTVTSLVEELPTCAAECLPDGADSINCRATDLNCLCQDPSRLVEAIGPCVFLKCSSEDRNKATEVAPDICSRVNDNPTPDDLADASRVVSAAIGDATGSGDDNPAHRNAASLGLVAALFVALLAA